MLITIFSEDLQHGFEITHNRSAFYYIALLGSILAVGRAIIPPATQVFQPEKYMQKVVVDTHYFPDEWRGKLHTKDVQKQFSSLFVSQYQLVFAEILSVLLAPWILYESLPKSAPGIVDFFLDRTIRVEGMGHVCTFAIFDSERDAELTPSAKMQASILNFRANNPSWNPARSQLGGSILQPSTMQEHFGRFFDALTQTQT